MKCYCYETETEFVYCVEGAKGKIRRKLKADPWWKQSGGKFLKVYPMDTGWDDAWYLDTEYKEAIIDNFARLGAAWIAGVFDWEKALLVLAQKFAENGIEWCIGGSVSEAVRGVDIKPHDIDIGVNVRDFYTVKELFRAYTMEPLGDNHGNWLVRYFGKLCVEGAQVDIAADEKLDRENLQLDKVLWQGYEVYVTPLQERYQVELSRKRKDRIRAIKAYMKKHG